MQGRPYAPESELRRKRFVRLVLAGVPWPDAIEQARVAPKRAVALLYELHAAGLLAGDEARAA